jgi:hypothetical protein
MEGLALIISIIALIFAVLAYQKVGGLGDKKKQSEFLSQIGDSIIAATAALREKTADALEKLETNLRTPQAPSATKKEIKKDE